MATNSIRLDGAKRPRCISCRGHEYVRKRSRTDMTTYHRFGGDIITILVGPEAIATRYFIHADLASKHSSFFQTCLKTGWKESAERIVRLPDLPADSAAVFEDFLSLLYTGKVYSIVRGQERHADGAEEWVRLGNAWILGEVLLSTSFKDAVVDAMMHKISSDDCMPTFEILPIYRHSPAGSPIRRLMVDIAANHWSEHSALSIETDDDPAILATFFQSVTIALMKRALQPKPAKKVKDPLGQLSQCLYHDHGVEPCYKTMF
jgi:hypothetical protein